MNGLHITSHEAWSSALTGSIIKKRKLLLYAQLSNLAPFMHLACSATWPLCPGSTAYKSFNKKSKHCFVFVMCLQANGAPNCPSNVPYEPGMGMQVCVGGCLVRQNSSNKSSVHTWGRLRVAFGVAGNHSLEYMRNTCGIHHNTSCAWLPCGPVRCLHAVHCACMMCTVVNGMPSYLAAEQAKLLPLPLLFHAALLPLQSYLIYRHMGGACSLHPPRIAAHTTKYIAFITASAPHCMYLHIICTCTCGRLSTALLFSLHRCCAARGHLRLQYRAVQSDPNGPCALLYRTLHPVRRHRHCWRRYGSSLV